MLERRMISGISLNQGIGMVKDYWTEEELENNDDE
jgi:hypothetical protein